MLPLVVITDLGRKQSLLYVSCHSNKCKICFFLIVLIYEPVCPLLQPQPKGKYEEKKKEKKDCSQICLQWMLADTFLFVFHLDYVEPQVLIFFNEAQISLNQHREEALPSVRESTERNLLSKRRCQWLFL